MNIVRWCVFYQFYLTYLYFFHPFSYIYSIWHAELYHCTCILALVQCFLTTREHIDTWHDVCMCTLNVDFVKKNAYYIVLPSQKSLSIHAYNCALIRFISFSIDITCSSLFLHLCSCSKLNVGVYILLLLPIVVCLAYTRYYFSSYSHNYIHIGFIIIKKYWF